MLLLLNSVQILHTWNFTGQFQLLHWGSPVGDHPIFLFCSSIPTSPPHSAQSRTYLLGLSLLIRTFSRKGAVGCLSFPWKLSLRKVVNLGVIPRSQSVGMRSEMEKEEKPTENVQSSWSRLWATRLSPLWASGELCTMQLGIVLLNIRRLGHLSTNSCDPLAEGFRGGC